MRVKRHLFWLVLYAAFVGAAYVLRSWMGQSGAAEIWGWDYGTFVRQIGEWTWITYMGFRHPGLGYVLSPLVAVQHVWHDGYLWFMPAVATATAWLIWKMGGRAGLAAWLVMPTTWLLAGTPESFPVAQLALVGSAWWLGKGPRSSFSRSGKDSASPLKCIAPLKGFISTFLDMRTVVAGAFALLNTMVTLTNGGKVVLAWLVTRAKMRDVARVLALGAFVLALGVAFFALRAHVNGRDWMDGIRATLAWIPEERNLPRELYGFFIRPVGLYQSFVVYPLALFGICQMIRKHQTSSLLVLASYFAVDACIHVIVGWGMKEPWVFAPHWIWILAILAGRGWGEVGGSSKKVRIRLVKRVLPVAETVLVRLSISR